MHVMVGKKQLFTDFVFCFMFNAFTIRSGLYFFTPNYNAKRCGDVINVTPVMGIC